LESEKKFSLSPVGRGNVERLYVENRAILERISHENTPRGIVAKAMYDNLPLKRND
jgi:hypothetical protein